MAQLSRVRIRRFKSLEDVDIQLNQLSLLVGGNNSGKTTVIQAIHFAFTLMQSLQIGGKWPTRDRAAVTVSPDELIYIPSLDPYSLGFGGVLREREDRAISIELVFSDGEQAELVVRKGRITNVMVQPTNVAYLRDLSGLEEPFSIFSPGLAGISKYEQYVSDGVLLRALSRGDANAFLRNILLRLHGQRPAWQAFCNDLETVFSGVEFFISFAQEIDENISVVVSKDGSRVPLDLVGTGLLQAVQILAYLHLFNPRVMLFDEPDSHLHPSNQRQLCTLFEEIADERGVQIVFTTHSRHMLDAIGGGAKRIWMQSGSARPVAIDDQIEVLLDLGALDVLERLQAGQERFVFLTEDSSDRTIGQVLSGNGFNEREFIVLPYKGVTNVHLLQPLIQHMRSVSQAQIVVHRDRDYLTAAEIDDWKTKIRSVGAEPFVTVDRDIEGYLISDEYLENYLRDNNLLPFDDLARSVVAGQDAATIERYINSRVDTAQKAGRMGNVNHGQMAVEANNMIQQDHWSMMLSKVRRKRIRHVLQQQHGHRFQDAIGQQIRDDPELQALRNRA